MLDKELEYIKEVAEDEVKFNYTHSLGKQVLQLLEEIERYKELVHVLTIANNSGLDKIEVLKKEIYGLKMMVKILKDAQERYKTLAMDFALDKRR